MVELQGRKQVENVNVDDSNGVLCDIWLFSVFQCVMILSVGFHDVIELQYECVVRPSGRV